MLREFRGSCGVEQIDLPECMWRSPRSKASVGFSAARLQTYCRKVTLRQRLNSPACRRDKISFTVFDFRTSMNRVFLASGLLDASALRLATSARFRLHGRATKWDRAGE